MRIHHIGVIVNNIQKSIEIYKKIKFTQISDIIYDDYQKIKVCFIMSKENNLRIELIESVSTDSSIHNFKEGYHHICYEVSSNNFIDEFKRLKIGKIFTKSLQATALNNRKVVFGCLNNKTFIEFLLKEN